MKIIENIIKVTHDIEGEISLSGYNIDSCETNTQHTDEKYFINTDDANNYQIDSDDILQQEVVSDLTVSVDQTTTNRSVENISVDEFVKNYEFIIKQQFSNYEIKEMKYTLDNVEFVKNVLVEKVTTNISESESA